MDSYILQHKNNRIAEVRFSDFYLPEIIRYIDKGLLLPRPASSDEDFIKWWIDRAIPRSRLHLSDMFPYPNPSTTRQFLLENLGLSLNDCYWLKPKCSALQWEEVNLFNGSWISLGYTPDASTGGILPKKWVEEDGKFFLCKGHHPGSLQQCYNEVLATRIHEGQNFTNYVSYELRRKPGFMDEACCSECFTDEKLEYIPAWDVIGRKDLREGISTKDLFFSFAERAGLDIQKVQNQIDYMNLSDFLLSNRDRHFFNFGFMRDSDTLEYVGLAPLFDTGNSMGFEAPWDADIEIELNMELKGFYSSTAELLENIKNPLLINIEKLPSEDDIKEFYSGSHLPEISINNISQLYEEKKKMLITLQQ